MLARRINGLGGLLHAGEGGVGVGVGGGGGGGGDGGSTGSGATGGKTQGGDGPLPVAPIGNRMFWKSDYMVHRQENYTVSE